jgi:putative membrane protein
MKLAVEEDAKTSTELKGMAQGVAEIPAAMDSSHQSKLDKPKELKGRDFTKQYRSLQVSAHKAASLCSSAMPRVATTRS